MNEVHLSRIIKAYYIERGLVWPPVWQALGWAHTEVGEAYEVLLRMGKKWKRNNPDKEGIPFNQFEFGEELGDAIMMLVVAGLDVGVDPIELLLQKIGRKAPDALKNT